MDANKYVFVWGNTQGSMTFEGDMRALEQFRDNPWNNINKMISVVRDSKASCYLSNQDVQLNRERGYKYFDHSFAENFLDSVDSVCLNHWKLFAELKALEYASLSNDKIFKLYMRIIDQWSNTISYFRGTQMEPTQVLAEVINLEVGPKEASILMLPSDLDPMNWEQIDWQVLLNNPYNETKILRHLEKYPWLVAYHFTLDQALHTLFERFNQDKESFVFRDIKKEKNDLQIRQNEIISAHPNTAYAARLLNKLSQARISLKACWGGTDFHLISLYAEISKRTGEPAEELAKYYLTRDLQKLLEGQALSDQEKERRKSCFVFFWNNGRPHIYSGEEAEATEKRELGLTDLADVQELKGVSANMGKMQGVVKVLGANDVEKARLMRRTFQQGEVLVTQMTQPNIMDIAKRAGAIITDEGGMLCHAAIISREFGIPCVVATHSATSVLKDGDLVEVDADNGVVKIIK